MYWPTRLCRVSPSAKVARSSGRNASEGCRPIAIFRRTCALCSGDGIPHLTVREKALYGLAPLGHVASTHTHRVRLPVGQSREVSCPPLYPSSGPPLASNLLSPNTVLFASGTAGNPPSLWPPARYAAGHADLCRFDCSQLRLGPVFGT